MSNKFKQDGIIDLYKILGLTKEMSEDIDFDKKLQKAYIKKSRLCHPDKVNEKFKNRKDITEMFELVTRAYNILKDPKKRELFNNKLSIAKQSSNDFSVLKKNAESYYDAVGPYIEPTAQNLSEFNNKMLEIDNRHGYDRSSSKTLKIPEKEMLQQLSDREKMRIQQDINLTPNKIFDANDFNIGKFNKAFEMIHKRENDTIIPHNGIPSAWNTTSAYSNFDDLDNIYVNDNENGSFGDFLNFNSNENDKKLTKEDILNISQADYTSGHNEITKQDMKIMKKKLEEREQQSKYLDSMKYSDYIRNDTAGYGIFDKLGYDYSDTISLDLLDDSNSLSRKFEKLMTSREKNISPSNLDQDSDISRYMVPKSR